MTTPSPDSVEDLARARVLERRERHRRRPKIVRALVVIAGVLLALGALVLVWAPELCLPLLVASLRLLALEFDRAMPAQMWAERQLLRVRGWLSRQSRTSKTIMWLVVAAVVAVVVLRMF